MSDFSSSLSLSLSLSRSLVSSLSFIPLRVFSLLKIWHPSNGHRESSNFSIQEVSPSRTDHCFTRKPYVFPNPRFSLSLSLSLSFPHKNPCTIFFFLCLFLLPLRHHLMAQFIIFYNQALTVNSRVNVFSGQVSEVSRIEQTYVCVCVRERKKKSYVALFAIC